MRKQKLKFQAEHIFFKKKEFKGLTTSEKIAEMVLPKRKNVVSVVVTSSF